MERSKSIISIVVGLAAVLIVWRVGFYPPVPEQAEVETEQPSEMAETAGTIGRTYEPEPIANGEDILVDSVYLVAKTGEVGVNIECRNLQAEWPARDFEVKRLIGKVSSFDDGFRLESLHLVTGRSNLFIAGTTGPSFTAGLNLSVGAEPIDLEDIRNLTGAKISGILDGVVGIRGDIGDFEGEATFDGTFLKRPFEDMSFTYQYSDKKLAFESIDGKVFHAGFKGSGWIDFPLAIQS